MALAGGNTPLELFHLAGRLRLASPPGAPGGLAGGTLGGRDALLARPYTRHLFQLKHNKPFFPEPTEVMLLSYIIIRRCCSS